MRAEGEDLTQSLVRLDAERRRGGARAATLAQQMRDAAEKRAELLADLIADDPAEVLRLELPARLQARMPANVQAMLEQRQEIEGELEVLHVDAEEAGASRFEYFLTTDFDERISLHFIGEAPGLVSGAKVRAAGLLLAGAKAVPGVETQGAMAIEPGEDNLEVLALGGTTTGTPASGLSNTFGEQRIAVLLVNFQDNPTNKPWTTTQIASLINGAASDFFAENSSDQTWLNADVFGWYTMALNSTSCSTLNIRDAAESAAANAGVDLSAYSRRVYLFPKISACSWWGTATIGGNPSRAWINGDPQLEVFGHEIGHNVGLYHSHSLNCTDGSIIGSSCQNLEYGDGLDVMGWSSSGHYSAFPKERLGWLGFGTSPSITEVQTSGSYTLTPYSAADSGPKALKILKSTDPVTGKRTWYYVEYRQAIGFDSILAGSQLMNSANILNGVVVHTGSPDTNGNTSYLLDMTPETYDLYTRDPALPVGRSFTDANAGVTITTLAANSGGATVAVGFGAQACVRANPQVAISPSQSQWVASGTPVAYTVTVTNKDGTACANATFALTSAVPSGWTGAYDSSSLTLAPGASGSRTLTVTSPASAADGFYTVTATAQNGTSYAGSATATYVISNPTANQPPVANNDSAATQSGKLVIIPVLANDSDPDGDALKVASATQGGGGTVVVSADNTLTYTAAATFSGTDSFSYTASDGRGGSDTAVVTVTVTAGNGPPVAVNDSGSTHAGTPVKIAVLANDSDPNGDVLSVTSAGPAKYGTVAVNPDKTVTYTPVTWFVGTDSFTYAIADGKGGTASATVTVTMTNTAAVAVDDSAATKINTPVTIRVLGNDYDPDGDPIYVKSVTQGGKGAVKINADYTVTYTPGTRFRGSDSFSYTIGDGRGGLDTATVTVTRLR